MSKLTLTNISNLGGNPAAAQIQINANNAAIVAALENTLSRDGSDPNQMEAIIDQNEHRIINLGAPAELDDAARLRDVLGLGDDVELAGLAPEGGLEGQVLTKVSDDDFDYEWAFNEAATGIEIQLACSNLTSDLLAATNVAYFRAPRAFTITSIRASLLVSSETGALTIDVNKNGSSIFSTPLTIDQEELTSTTAATPAVISDTAVADDDEFRIDLDNAGLGARGLIVTILGSRS